MLKKYYCNQIEKQMLSFMNLMENFSMSDDDIVNICDRTDPYLKEPLKGIIHEFVMEARLYGDMEDSFDKLMKRLRGTKLKEVFQNIKICSVHNTNYKEVIKDARSSVKQYLRSKSIQKAVIKSARVDLAALVAAGAIIIKILNEFLTQDVFTILRSGYIGVAIMVYCVAVLLWGVYYLFWRQV